MFLIYSEEIPIINIPDIVAVVQVNKHTTIHMLRWWRGKTSMCVFYVQVTISEKFMESTRCFWYRVVGNVDSPLRTRHYNNFWMPICIFYSRRAFFFILFAFLFWNIFYIVVLLLFLRRWYFICMLPYSHVERLQHSQLDFRTATKWNKNDRSVDAGVGLEARNLHTNKK